MESKDNNCDFETISRNSDNPWSKPASTREYIIYILFLPLLSLSSFHSLTYMTRWLSPLLIFQLSVTVTDKY